MTLRLAGATIILQTQQRPPVRRLSARDERRVTAEVRRIESATQEEFTLGQLARGVDLSPYHFLRVFRQVVGMTPHQFILHTRLHRAAVRLRHTADAITAIAYETGFKDLSTFNRRFRRLIGSSPSVYRMGNH